MTLLINNLIAREKQQCVGVVLESLHNCEDAVQVAIIVALPWSSTVDTLTGQWRVDIEQEVDADGVEDASAKIMVDSGVEIVYTDSIHTQFLHQCGVSKANSTIAQWIAAGVIP